MSAIGKLLLATIVGIMLLVLNWSWYQYICIPALPDLFTFVWQCEVTPLLIAFSFISAGASHGYLTDRNPWLGGIYVAVLILAVCFFTPFLKPWYGSGVTDALRNALFHAIIPAILGSVGAYWIQHRSRDLAL